MDDQRQTLEYENATPRYAPRIAVALPIVIGVAVSIVTLCCVATAGGYDPVSSFISRLAFDEKHLIFCLPPLAIIGVVVGTIGWIKSQRPAALTGLVLSMFAFFLSMGASAVHAVIYFWVRH